jgi:DNA-binding CsgD family transcriptional regulator
VTTTSPQLPEQASVPGTSATALETSLDAFVRYLADDPRGEAVGGALLRGPLALLGASAAIVFAASADRESLRCVASANYPPGLLHQLALLPVEAHHVACRVFRSGVEEVWSVTEAATQHPVMRAAAEVLPGGLRGEIASLPLRSRGETIGVLGFKCPDGLPRTWDSRRVVDGVTGALSLWVALQRALDVEAIAPDRSPLAVTARQRRVLELVREGSSNSQIAVLLGYSEKTIKNDLTSLYRLLGASSRDELVARAFDLTADAG